MRTADFDYFAMEYFGFERPEARELLLRFEESGGTIRGVDAEDRNFWADLSRSDAFAELIEEQEYEEPEQYALDSRFPDDAYLDPGEEWELTAESIEGYGDD